LGKIASGIGTPLTIDDATQSKLFGIYALVEREGHAFPVEVQYEKLPLFCTHCKCLGHSIQLGSSTTQQGPRDIQRKAQNTILNKHSLPHKKYVPVFESQEGEGEFPASTTDPGRVEETSAQDKVETSTQDKVEFLAKDTNQTVENLNLGS